MSTNIKINILIYNESLLNNYYNFFKEEDDFIIYEWDATSIELEEFIIKNKIEIILLKSDLNNKKIQEIRKLNINHKDLKIAITGKEKESRVLDYIKWGFRGHLNFENDPALLIRAMKAIYKGEMWFDRKVASKIFEEFAKDTPKIWQPEVLDSLTKREKEILGLVAKGYKNIEIAKSLFISEKTVKTHLYKSFEKLGVKNRQKAALIFKQYKTQL